MAVQILPPIFRTPGAQDDYPFFVLKPDGSARDITNDFIEVSVGDDVGNLLFSGDSSDPTKVEKDDPTNGGVTLHIAPDAVNGAAQVTRYSVRLTPNETAPGPTSVVIGEGVFTVKASMFVQPYFTLTPAMATASVVAGGGAVIGVDVTSINNFDGTVTLSTTVSPIVVNGPVAGITTPAVLTPGITVGETLTITTVLATPPGAYIITITGVSGVITRTALVDLTVT